MSSSELPEFLRRGGTAFEFLRPNFLDLVSRELFKKSRAGRKKVFAERVKGRVEFMALRTAQASGSEG